MLSPFRKAIFLCAFSLFSTALYAAEPVSGQPYATAYVAHADGLARVLRPGRVVEYPRALIHFRIINVPQGWKIRGFLVHRYSGNAEEPMRLLEDWRTDDIEVATAYPRVPGAVIQLVDGTTVYVNLAEKKLTIAELDGSTMDTPIEVDRIDLKRPHEYATEQEYKEAWALAIPLQTRPFDWVDKRTSCEQFLSQAADMLASIRPREFSSTKLREKKSHPVFRIRTHKGGRE